MRRFTLATALFLMSIFAMPTMAATTVTVHVFGFGFSLNPKGQPQADPVIFIGDTIHWVWDSGGHNTASDPNQKESWTSAILKQGGTFDHTFNNAGVFTYVCTPHKSFMAGKVIVLDPTLTIDTFTLKPTSVKGGSANSTGTVTLKAKAGTNGTVVTLSSNNANATVPASIKITSGKISGTFTVTTKKVTANVDVTITAKIGNATPVTAKLTLTK